MASSIARIPDWVIDLPPAAATIEIDGVRPHRSASRCQALGGGRLHVRRRHRNQILQPQMLVLLPEEERFYLVYRRTFQLAPHSGIECSFRLRLENAWRTGQ